MKLEKIEIKSNGISIKHNEIAYDKDGNEIGVLKSSRKALGINNFAADPANTTQAEKQKYYDEIDNLCQSAIGQTLSQILADTKVSQDQLQAVKNQLAIVKAERDTLQADIDAVKAERDRLRNQVQSAE